MGVGGVGARKIQLLPLPMACVALSCIGVQSKLQPKMIIQCKTLKKNALKKRSLAGNVSSIFQL